LTKDDFNSIFTSVFGKTKLYDVFDYDVFLGELGEKDDKIVKTIVKQCSKDVEEEIS
jgi:hypothetical protein